MADDEKKPAGPDLTQGVPLQIVGDNGNLIGHIGDEDVLVVRRGDEVFAIGARCTHYHGPLAEGPKDCLLRYKKGGRVLAVASISRDVESLKAEVAMEGGAA
jgi:nitrite reductase/ring-hydroxylating ferredoxin subunit